MDLVELCKLVPDAEVVGGVAQVNRPGGNVVLATPAGDGNILLTEEGRAMVDEAKATTTRKKAKAATEAVEPQQAEQQPE